MMPMDIKEWLADGGPHHKAERESDAFAGFNHDEEQLDQECRKYHPELDKAFEWARRAGIKKAISRADSHSDGLLANSTITPALVKGEAILGLMALRGNSYPQRMILQTLLPLCEVFGVQAPSPKQGLLGVAGDFALISQDFKNILAEMARRDIGRAREEAQRCAERFVQELDILKSNAGTIKNSPQNWAGQQLVAIEHMAEKGFVSPDCLRKAAKFSPEATLPMPATLARVEADDLLIAMESCGKERKDAAPILKSSEFEKPAGMGRRL